MLQIDGSMGEGGGQVLRTSLALSAVTETPFRIENIRAKRRRPGLLRQHLTAVRAVAEICNARLTGDELGASELCFEPRAVTHGEYHFAVGTAGSATLVFQSVLPPLLTAEGRSRLVFEGGTHNPMAPPFDFIQSTFLPLLRRMGASICAELIRPGFYPAGGGRFVVELVGGTPLGRLELLERGEVQGLRLRAMVADVPEHVAERELQTLATQLSEFPIQTELLQVRSTGPGNVVCALVRSSQLTETFTGFGERGVRAETVASRLAGQIRKYLAADAAAGEHLADQLLIPMALGQGGRLRCTPLSLHTATNMDVIRRFLRTRLEYSSETGILCVAH